MSAKMSASSQESPQLQYALYYARLGWSVVPSHKSFRLPDGRQSCTCRSGIDCVSKGKHPAGSWKKYQTERASEDEIRSWFTGQYSDYGVGIITGAVSGIFVVDVDEGPGKTGGDTINDLQFINGDLPHTITAKTGGGGRHIILKHPGDGKLIGTAKNVFGPGVDVRGDGGFIVAAPSLHESGRYYLWDEHSHPHNVPIADAPDWVIETASGTPSAGSASGPATGTGEIIRDAWSKVTDGRERHMIGVICGVIASKLRKDGALPTADAVFAEAWPSYERTTRARGASLEEDCRGETLMRSRVIHMLQRAESGKWKVSAEPRHTEHEERHDGAGFSASPKEPKPGLPLVYFSDIQPNLDCADFIEGVLIEGGMSVVYGESNCGKTFFMTDLGVHVAMGKSWRGKEVELGGVIYCALEGSHGISNRIAAFRLHHGLGALELPFAVIPVGINLLDPDADTDRLIEAIKTAAGEMTVKVRLVVIDTLSRALAGGNENAPDDMGALVTNADKIRQATGAHLAFVHHSGKDTAKGARGHSLLRAATDTEIEVARPDKDSPSTARVTKQRELEIDGEFSFKLEVVELGKNRRGKAVTSCAVVPTDVEGTGQTGRDGGKAARLPPNASLGMRALHLAMDKKGAFLPRTSDYPDSETYAVSDAAWREEFYQLKSGTPDTNKHAFSSGETVLLARKIITARNGLVWISRKEEAGR